jgi:hypothetical protein
MGLGNMQVDLRPSLTETKLILARSIPKVHYRPWGRTREELWREGRWQASSQQVSVPSISDSIDFM